jgi:hypothetical protein
VLERPARDAAALISGGERDDDVGEGRDRRARGVGQRDDRRATAVAIDRRGRLF